MALYGLGYGAGAMGAGLGAGLVQGMTMAPQLQGLNLANQQRQMSLDEQKAAQQEYALYPKVFSDPSIRDADGNLIPEKVMGMLPHTGAQALGQLGMYNYRQGMTNLNEQRRQGMEQDALRQKNQMFSSMMGSALNIPDPSDRLNFLRQSFTRNGMDPNSIDPSMITDQGLQAAMNGGLTGFQQAANQIAVQKGRDAMKMSQDRLANALELQKLKNKGKLSSIEANAQVQERLSREGIKIPGNLSTYALANWIAENPDQPVMNGLHEIYTAQAEAQGKDADSKAESYVNNIEKARSSIGKPPLSPADHKALADEYKARNVYRPAPPLETPRTQAIPGQSKLPPATQQAPSRAQVLNDAKIMIQNGADPDSVIKVAKDKFKISFTHKDLGVE
jgi:hypothetical protein